MTIPRFYCPQPIGKSAQVALEAKVANHAFRALRLQRGDRLTLFDGTGGEFEASVHAISPRDLLVDVGRYVDVERESPLQVCIAQALSTGERMAFTLEKCVELGATRFQPIISERSVVRLSGERAERRQQHWQQICVAACEQCGRNRVPPVEESAEFDLWIASLPAQVSGIVLAPDGTHTLSSLPPPSGEWILAVGPEGGFTDDELDLLARRGFATLRLGPRILRTETAAAAALAAMQRQWGDFT